ncbi:HEPN domain protein [Ferroglobus placidus DSM 10642]|uniref:HEPN domain protein n=1 Tax=Ferroglobus placidus (strain DSM 10642 / AEDII12DO) TaxID=589924 RepID=D3RY31_FERPA|nr:HEPN domain-containing protein [Ferroglobus placidus]ADC65394.1 HEPN domain protein [Ferroglobus placidus DSM 10642]
MEELFDRAKKFLKEAEDDINKEFYDLCMFHLEQALRLLLKYILAKKVGYFSKTHSLLTLKEELKEVEPKISEFLDKNRRIVRELERAYIGARYLPFTYEKEEAVEALKFVKEVFRLYEGD